FAQPIGEGIELHPPIERAEGGRTEVRALAAPANCMACRTHSICEGAAMPLQRGWLAVLGRAGRGCEQHKNDGEYCHLESAPLGKTAKCQFARRHERPPFGGASIRVPSCCCWAIRAARSTLTAIGAPSGSRCSMRRICRSASATWNSNHAQIWAPLRSNERSFSTLTCRRRIGSMASNWRAPARWFLIWIKKARTSLSFSCRQSLPAGFLAGRGPPALN